jgi:hypothetical protein
MHLPFKNIKIFKTVGINSELVAKLQPQTIYENHPRT